MQDVLIIGGGAAGASAALYARQAGVSVTLVAKACDNAGQTEKIETYYGFAEPVTREALLHAGKWQTERMGVVWLSDEIVAMQHENGLFHARGTRGEYAARAVVLATGAACGIPRMEGLVQHEGQGVSDCMTRSATQACGQRVAVLGSGRYALHEATTLLTKGRAVTLLTNGLPAPLQLPAKLLADERKIRAIVGEDQVYAVAFENGDPLEVDGVLVAWGVLSGAALAKKLGAATCGNHVVVDAEMAATVPGVFAAGDCVGGLSEMIKAAYEGAVAGRHAAAFLQSKPAPKG